VAASNVVLNTGTDLITVNIYGADFID